MPPRCITSAARPRGIDALPSFPAHPGHCNPRGCWQGPSLWAPPAILREYPRIAEGGAWPKGTTARRHLNGALQYSYFLEQSLGNMGHTLVAMQPFKWKRTKAQRNPPRRRPAVTHSSSGNHPGCGRTPAPPSSTRGLRRGEMAGRHRASPRLCSEGTQGWGGCTGQKSHLQRQSRTCMRCDFSPEHYPLRAISMAPQPASSDPAWGNSRDRLASRVGSGLFHCIPQKTKK